MVNVSVGVILTDFFVEDGDERVDRVRRGESGRLIDGAGDPGVPYPERNCGQGHGECERMSDRANGY